jgi:hypothetical protein
MRSKRSSKLLPAKGQPEIVNTDQGRQFTATAFTETVFDLGRSA